MHKEIVQGFKRHIDSNVWKYLQSFSFGKKNSYLLLSMFFITFGLQSKKRPDYSNKKQEFWLFQGH